jgi:hypothetical protein
MMEQSCSYHQENLSYSGYNNSGSIQGYYYDQSERDVYHNHHNHPGTGSYWLEEEDDEKSVGSLSSHHSSTASSHHINHNSNSNNNTLLENFDPLHINSDIVVDCGNNNSQTVGAVKVKSESGKRSRSEEGGLVVRRKGVGGRRKSEKPPSPNVMKKRRVAANARLEFKETRDSRNSTINKTKYLLVERNERFLSKN